MTGVRAIPIRPDVLDYATKLEDPVVIRSVRKALKENTLTLVFGAGVSSGLKLPLWPILVQQLYDDVFREIDPGKPAPSVGDLFSKGYTFTTMIRQLEVLSGYPSDIRAMVRDRLYAGLYERGAKELIDPLCKTFLVKGAPAPVNHVITYNFDNCVERRMRKLGRRDTVSIYSDATYAKRGRGVQIYHPHGFLPHKDDDPADDACNESVVFSERDYNEQYMETGNWATILQLHHFMHHTCLFVGVSLTDPNMRRLLDHARRRTGSDARHIALMKSRRDAFLDGFQARDLQSLGVKTLWAADFSEYPRVLAKCADI